MNMHYPIADMFTRIRNAHQVAKEAVSMPSSRLKAGICRVLKEEGYIEDFAVQTEEASSKSTLTIWLKYYQHKPVIAYIRPVSLPSCRVYAGTTELPQVLSGLGIAIISTSHGLMTDRKARQLQLGGEVLCAVY